MFAKIIRWLGRLLSIFGGFSSPDDLRRARERSQARGAGRPGNDSYEADGNGPAEPPPTELSPREPPADSRSVK